MSKLGRLLSKLKPTSIDEATIQALVREQTDVATGIRKMDGEWCIWVLGPSGVTYFRTQDGTEETATRIVEEVSAFALAHARANGLLDSG